MRLAVCLSNFVFIGVVDSCMFAVYFEIQVFFYDTTQGSTLFITF